MATGACVPFAAGDALGFAEGAGVALGDAGVSPGVAPGDAGVSPGVGMDTPGGGVSIRLRRGPGEIARTGSDNFERRGGDGEGVGVFCGGGVSLG